MVTALGLTPEQAARQNVDAALAAAGWAVQDAKVANLYAAAGVALREFGLKGGYGAADYMLFADGKAVGVVEAKAEGDTLTGVEPQTGRYSEGLPDTVPSRLRPLPFLYISTGTETRFTNQLDPEPRSRGVFHFHQPATLAAWADQAWPAATAAKGGPASRQVAELKATYGPPSMLRSRLQHLPPIDPTGLWPAQFTAVGNLEESLRSDRPRALVQMATGSGKTYTAISSTYRLIKFGGARRVLFLVDRANLGRQALKEFQQYVPPDDNRHFHELYNVKLLTTNRIDPVDKVVITTIQRLYSMLQGEEELDPALEEGSQFDTGASLVRQPVPVAYNPRIPVEFFDFIFTDECHRSIYHLWRQVLEYFDAYLVGLTATPSKQTLGFFHQNLVMEYNHDQAVVDGVNVDYDVYRIQTHITERGSRVDASHPLDYRDRLTRKKRWEVLDEDFTYEARALDRDVVAVDQIRTVIQTFRDKLFTEIFPGRTEVPKTLIYAKDDSHADDIVQIVREEFGKGNDFCQKITYRTSTARIVTHKTQADGQEVEEVSYRSSGVKPEDLLSGFRNSYNPRVVVTVDMIATGTDIKPLEIVMFMRAVKSRNFFEQMKGRGVRIIGDTDFQAVTPDAKTKTRFVLVDCVGVTEQELSDSPPLERKPAISFHNLLQAVAYGNAEPDVVSSLASRLARLDRQLGKPDQEALAGIAGGVTLHQLVAQMVAALDPDRQAELARQESGLTVEEDPAPEQIAAAARTLLSAAVKPLAANPALRDRLESVKQQFEQAIDTVSKDAVLLADYSEAARDRAREVVGSFEQFIRDHKDEITALQVLYSRPYQQRLRFRDIKQLAEAIAAPPRSWTPEALWQAYETLDRSKVRGSGTRMLTDIVSLVRYALHQDGELVPYGKHVEMRFAQWLAQQEQLGRRFTDEQLTWLKDIRDHVATSVAIEMDDFDETPFREHGGAGRVYQLFGAELASLLKELNEVLAA